METTTYSFFLIYYKSNFYKRNKSTKETQKQHVFTSTFHTEISMLHSPLTSYILFFFG